MFQILLQYYMYTSQRIILKKRSTSLIMRLLEVVFGVAHYKANKTVSIISSWSSCTLSFHPLVHPVSQCSCYNTNGWELAQSVIQLKYCPLNIKQSINQYIQCLLTCCTSMKTVNVFSTYLSMINLHSLRFQINVAVMLTVILFFYYISKYCMHIFSRITCYRKKLLR